MNSQQTPFVSRERINFFAHIGDVYPTEQIKNSKCRLFMSIFHHPKAFVVLKTGDARQPHNFTKVSAQLFRKDSALMLRLFFHGKTAEESFYSFLPVDAIRDGLVAPKYPAQGESMEMEIHLVEYLNGDVLSKVVRASFDDPKFIQRLCDEYEQQRASETDPEIMLIDKKAILSMSIHSIDKYFLGESSMTTIKDAPDEHEPLLLDEVNNVYDIVN